MIEGTAPEIPPLLFRLCGSAQQKENTRRGCHFWLCIYKIRSRHIGARKKKKKMSGCCFILIPLLFINVCKDPYFLTPQIKPSLKQQTEHITSDVFTT